MSTRLDKRQLPDIFQTKVIPCTTATAAATAAKVVTIENYTLAAGDIFAVTFTSGNTANSPTISINGSSGVQIRTSAGRPTSASGTGAAYASANGTMLMYYNGTYFCLMGSQDLTDYSSDQYLLYGAYLNQFNVHNPTVGNTTTAYFAFVGLCEDGSLEKVTATTSAITAGERIFTTNKLSLLDNILYTGVSTIAWTAGSPYTTFLYSRAYTSNWKYAIGNYYNKSGVLVTNNVTTDLAQTPVYIGGTQDGDYFIPMEYSLTLRSTNYVYKLIGYFCATGTLYISDYQPAFVYDGNAWVRFPLHQLPGLFVINEHKIFEEKKGFTFENRQIYAGWIHFDTIPQYVQSININDAIGDVAGGMPVEIIRWHSRSLILADNAGKARNDSPAIFHTEISAIKAIYTKGWDDVDYSVELNRIGFDKNKSFHVWESTGIGDNFSLIRVSLYLEFVISK